MWPHFTVAMDFHLPLSRSKIRGMCCPGIDIRVLGKFFNYTASAKLFSMICE